MVGEQIRWCGELWPAHPIVVNDIRGIFTSRLIGMFVNEALAMLGEGVKFKPANIEHAGSQAGYPAPPLQLSDELNLELMHNIATATRKGVEDARRVCPMGAPEVPRQPSARHCRARRLLSRLP